MHGQYVITITIIILVAILQVYVIDSGCSDEHLSVSQEVLTSCLRSPSLTNLPLLVVCSKQDLPAARSVNEVL